MKIDRKFNTLTKKEYLFYIDNQRKYTDFNTLGLYRSILENNKLSLQEQKEIRDYAHTQFKRSFDFLQLKDPFTFMEITHLGENLTRGDEIKIWDDIRLNQQKILKDKRIKHRNFGDYSKHNCGHDDCIWNGVMVRQGSIFAENSMHFREDQNKYQKQLKAKKRKSLPKEKSSKSGKPFLSK